MSTHAKLSPSAAFRWMSCTAAPGLEATMPDKTSEFAEEGSRAHTLAEVLARDACDLDFKPPGMLIWDEEMEDAAKIYANYIKETYLSAKKTCTDAVIETEQRLDLTRWIPEGFGTADCLIVADGTLHVIDFKYGKGVPVYAEENKQMMIYALGALDWASLLYDIKEVRMTIIQPRIDNNSSWSLPADELEKWGTFELRPLAKIAFEGGGNFKPTEDNCRFCKAAGVCKARADYFVNLFEDNDDTDSLSTEDAACLLTRAAGMKAWLQALEETVKSACLKGEELPGWKIVEGRTKRRYTDEEEIAKRLKAKKYKVSDIYEKKLLGISKMEKLVGKKKLAEICGDLIEKPAGSPTLVPESDERPRWDPEEKTIAAFDE